MATHDPFWLFRTERLRHVGFRQIYCRFGSLERSDAYENSGCGFAHACSYRKPSGKQRGLHTESHRNGAPRLWARNQKSPDPSRSTIDPGNMAGTGSTDHRGCGYRCHRRRRNAVIHLCNDKRVCARSSGYELVGATCEGSRSNPASRLGGTASTPRPMSAFGPKPTSHPLPSMSALGGKANPVRSPADVAV
jgi:hypothetical protein